MTDALRFVFLELVRFKKGISELETKFDKWMYLLRHMHEMTEIPEVFQDSEFKRLFILAEIGNFTSEEYKQYQKSLGSMSDYYNIIDTATEEAEKRGMAEGILIGREEGRQTTARNLKKLGVAFSTIAEATGLPLDVIEGL
jgi:predicted transposase/invertase (TIGR01784 family)